MRQYRGIPIGETEFVYGWYVECEKGKHYIVPAPTTWEHMGILFAPLHAQVIPETVKIKVAGQWFNADELSAVVKKGLDK